MTIYKYSLNLKGLQTIVLPSKFDFLDVQVQNGIICLWFFVDTTKPKVPKNIYIYGTGEDIDFSRLDKDTTYLGTVQLDTFVWHVFGEKHARVETL